MEANKKLIKLANEQNFRHAEDVELRLNVEDFVAEDGSFKTALAEDKIKELAKNRPDLILREQIEDNTPPSATKKEETRLNLKLPKTKHELHTKYTYEEILELKKLDPNYLSKLK